MHRVLVANLSNRLSSIILKIAIQNKNVTKVNLSWSILMTSTSQPTFSNTKIIIDCFHIVQLVGRALENYRVSLTRSLDKKSREYKILKSQCGYFKKMNKLEDRRPTYLKRINEYMTQQNVIDLVTKKFPKFKTIYQMYQGITLALRDKAVTRRN
ncbi:transposase [Lactobacillus sp. AN1001]